MHKETLPSGREKILKVSKTEPSWTVFAGTYFVCLLLLHVHRTGGTSKKSLGTLCVDAGIQMVIDSRDKEPQGQKADVAKTPCLCIDATPS